MPLNVVLRDVLKLAYTNREVKKILNSKEILVNGVRIKEPRFIVGFMDTISIEEIKKHCRILLNHRGKVILQEIKKDESSVKICKIINKKNIKDRIQLNLFDGRNILVKEDKYKTNDSLLINLPKQEIKDHIELKKKNTIFLIGGRYVGSVGTIEDVQNDNIIFKCDNRKLETTKNNVFVIGRDKPLIDIK